MQSHRRPRTSLRSLAGSSAAVGISFAGLGGALGGGLAAVPIAATAAEILVDGVAAQVGTSIVLLSDVMSMVGPMEAQMRDAQAPPAEIAKLRVEGLERMIEWKLIEQVVSQTELYATDAETDGAIEAIARENGLTPDQLRESVTAHMTYDDYRSQIKREIERSKVVNLMVSSKIKVEPDEVERRYSERFSDQPDGGEQFHLRQILIPPNPAAGVTGAAACQRVREARERIVAGEPFENVAREGNVISPERGGDIGWVHSDNLARWMSKVVRELEPGEVSEVIEQRGACSLLQLVDRREYTPVTFEVAKSEIEREIYGELEAKQYREWLEELRENTYIERRGPFSASSGPSLQLQ
jgi:peptidyl-prolyl cis-trans isomerase SurA